MTQLLLIALLIAVFLWIYRGYSRYQRSEYSSTQFRNFTITKETLAKSELGLFVALVAKVAKADGRVDELEAELVGNMFTDISRLFPDPEKVRTLLKEIFSIEKENPFNTDDVAIALYGLIRNDPHKRLQMMQFLVNLAYIDGTLSREEETMLHTIATLLHLRDEEFKAILDRFASYHRHSFKESSLDQAYALLEVSKDASDDELKKAYRALVKRHHPDIVKAQGLSDDYIREATEKVQEINAAYELIKKVRSGS